jgi:hypothetical protein
MSETKFLKVLLILLLFTLVVSITAQTKRNKRSTAPAKKDAQTEKKEPAKPEPTPTPANAAKKNSRPVSENVPNETPKTQTNKPPDFVYEYSRPSFPISHIVIEHDENGKGKITFKKKDFDEEYDDPIQLSAATLETLRTHFDALNFLGSTEDYQYEKDYSHLGNVKITLRKEGKERTAAYNWTTNTDAKALMDEYRKISNQYLWMFDMTVARRNQPLETPKIMKAMDGYIRRNEISDPPQMIPFLQDLSNDERVPLITRNDVANLVKQIEKKKKD